MADPHRVERNARLLGELVGGLAPRMAVLAAQPPDGERGEIRAVIGRIRDRALGLLRGQIGLAFGDDPDSPATDQLARFALAAIDGAFVASQTDPEVGLEWLLEPLAPALVAARRATLDRAPGDART